MIEFKDYVNMIKAENPGRAKKIQSDNIMLNTWWQDMQSQTAYLYDMFHDVGEEHFKLNDLHPQTDMNKIAIPIKFIRHASQTYAKDPVTYWLQLQPGQECNVDYFDEMYGRRYSAIWPVSMYIDIMDESGKYNKWLVVNIANYNQNQFPTFELLRCDYKLQWIYKGKKYECPGVLQSQNSYNSGLWTDFKFTSVEDQQKFACPLNTHTETLFYNRRILLDSNLYNSDSEPRTWIVSKVNRISPNGILRLTMAQDLFNQHNDYIERDEDGVVIGLWADYFSSEIAPVPVEISVSESEDNINIPTVTSVITCSGRPQIRIGGSPKTFVVNYYDENNQEISDFEIGTWEFLIDNNPITDYTDLIDLIFEDNNVKVKFLGDDNYIGKILTVTNVAGDVTASLDVEIMAL